MRKSTIPVVIGLLTCMALTACSKGGAPTATETLAPVGATPTTAAGASPSGASSDAGAAPTKRQACASLTQAEAVAKWMPQARVGEGWSDMKWEEDSNGLTTYSPCAALSWAIISVKGPTGSTPRPIMLFNRGQYVGKATKETPGFYPEVKRLADGSISVTYTYARDGEPMAAPSGRATSIFTWDDATKKVTRTGELPPHSGGAESEPTPTQPQAAPVSGAFPGAGGPIPAGAKPIKSVITNQYSGVKYAVVLSPSGNIGCHFSAEDAGCGVSSYVQEGKYGSKEFPEWFFALDQEKVPAPLPKSDAPYFDEYNPSHQRLGYGQVAYYLNYVCASAGSRGLGNIADQVPEFLSWRQVIMQF